MFEFSYQGKISSIMGAASFELMLGSLLIVEATTFLLVGSKSGLVFASSLVAMI